VQHQMEYIPFNVMQQLGRVPAAAAAGFLGRAAQQH